MLYNWVRLIVSDEQMKQRVGEHQPDDFQYL